MNRAEIVLYLSEREPRAARWEDIALRDGALTLVGDPKQSIYRFRRADIDVYNRVKKRIGECGGGTLELCANFRSLGSIPPGSIPSSRPRSRRTATAIRRLSCPSKRSGRPSAGPSPASTRSPFPPSGTTPRTASSTPTRAASRDSLPGGPPGTSG